MWASIDLQRALRHPLNGKPAFQDMAGHIADHMAHQQAVNLASVVGKRCRFVLGSKKA